MEMKGNSHGTLRYLVFTLIIILTLASISNIYEAAQTFHGGWFLPSCISVSFAVGFSLCVYIVMTSETKQTKNFAVLCAVVFGTISGTMQTWVYISHGANLLMALCFGFLVPGMEGLLASLEAMMNAEGKDVVPTVSIEKFQKLESENGRLHGEVEEGKKAHYSMAQSLRQLRARLKKMEQEAQEQTQIERDNVQPIVQVSAAETGQVTVAKKGVDTNTRRLHVLFELGKVEAGVAASQIADKINNALGTDVGRQHVNNDKKWLAAQGWFDIEAWTITGTGQQMLANAVIS